MLTVTAQAKVRVGIPPAGYRRAASRPESGQDGTQPSPPPAEPRG